MPRSGVLRRTVREHLKLTQGQKLAVELGDGYVTLRPIRGSRAAPRQAGHDWRTLQGCLRGTDALGALIEDRRAEVKTGR